MARLERWSLVDRPRRRRDAPAKRTGATRFGRNRDAPGQWFELPDEDVADYLRVESEFNAWQERLSNIYVEMDIARTINDLNWKEWKRECIQSKFHHSLIVLTSIPNRDKSLFFKVKYLAALCARVHRCRWAVMVVRRK